MRRRERWYRVWEQARLFIILIDLDRNNMFILHIYYDKQSTLFYQLQSFIKSIHALVQNPTIITVSLSVVLYNL